MLSASPGIRCPLISARGVVCNPTKYIYMITHSLFAPLCVKGFRLLHPEMEHLILAFAFVVDPFRQYLNEQYICPTFLMPAEVRFLGIYCGLPLCQDQATSL